MSDTMTPLLVSCIITFATVAYSVYATCENEDKKYSTLEAIGCALLLLVGILIIIAIDDRRPNMGDYTCLDCGETFDTPVKYTEKHGLDSPPYETWNGCPSCGSGAYVVTKVCDKCGEVITGEYVEVDGERYCENCYTLHHIEDDL